VALVKQARELAFSPVVGQAMAGNKDFLGLFTANKKQAEVNKQVTGLEDRWNSSARDNYGRAKTLAEQALGLAR
jgi:phosphoglycerate transport regulatory protein PgtC